MRSMTGEGCARGRPLNRRVPRILLPRGAGEGQ